MAGKVKTWVWVALGVVVVGILCIIAAAGVGLYFFSQHVQTHAVSPSKAAHDFEQIETRFTGQKPLIELDSHGRYLRAHTDRTPPPNPASPDALNVLAFDPDDGRIVRISIPFWLLRLKLHGTTINFNGNKMDLEDLKLTVEDLERFGPTLIVDHKNVEGARVLVWSQ